ncbi:MAG: ABC transporter permease [Gammaproteobacteria bacterium]|nr:ABC transporter permease [Gammaproteobacteria bacterium]MBT3684478.1 ABC transporter permease [Cryomorphaceae bacterium]MBT6754861.1 ABC transporter permease [Gammaproteobacteria bacterium]MBT7523361.1 ABC transporter permease [Gammaproteobacteria bacterium]MBT7814299.1 ABC transporter permease [Gammaproteobacteria bacterium]
MQAVAYKTIVRKEVLRFSRIWKQTLIPPVITNILYFIIFGNLIGDRIGEIESFSYTDFIFPGLLLMSVITHSYTNTVSSLYISKYHRYIEELLVSPIQNYTILAGFITGGVIRGLSVGVVVILAAQFFVTFTVHNIFLMLVVIFLSSTLFSMCGFLNGLFANDWDDINVIPTFIMTPLTYLGGIFFSISMLPGIWQEIALINPILYLINALRFSMLGITDVSIMIAFSIILLFNIVLASLCLYFLNIGKGLRT